MAMMDEVTLSREVDAARARKVDRDPRQVIQWAYDLLGEGLMMTTSFQKSGMILLHMMRDIAPRIPVFFLDTGFHFKESVEFAKTIREEWRVNVIIKKPELYGDPFDKKHGKLYETNPDLCCHLNKVEPQKEILQNYQGWISGVRRDQAATRGAAEELELLEGGKLKVLPLVRWTRDQVSEYLEENKIPSHPLFAKGYPSIGCQPCTQPCHDPSNERAGRWMGKAKTECGLHTFWKKAEPKETKSSPAEFVGKLTDPPSVGKRVAN